MPETQSQLASSLLDPRALDPALSIRRRLLAGMAQTVADHGYRAAAIGDIVGRARVSKRSFYDEFDQKEACFRDLYEQLGLDLRHRVLAAFDERDAWQIQVRGAVSVVYATFAASPGLTHALFVEMATLSPTAVAVHRRGFDDFAVLTTELVERIRLAHPGVRSRALTPLMAAALTSGVTHLLLAAVENGTRDDALEQVLTTCVELVSTAVTGEPEPSGD